MMSRAVEGGLEGRKGGSGERERTFRQKKMGGKGYYYSIADIVICLSTGWYNILKA